MPISSPPRGDSSMTRRALAEALRNKLIAGAGLDVWAKEPPPPDHPLLQFDNVLASPHTAGVTKEARINMGRIAAEQLLDALDGKRPPRHYQSRSMAALRHPVRAGFRVRPGIAVQRRTLAISAEKISTVTGQIQARKPLPCPNRTIALLLFSGSPRHAVEVGSTLSCTLTFWPFRTADCPGSRRGNL